MCEHHTNTRNSQYFVRIIDTDNSIHNLLERVHWELSKHPSICWKSRSSRGLPPLAPPPRHCPWTLEGAYTAPTPSACVQVTKLPAMRTLLPPIKKINKNPVGHSSFSGNACRDKVPRFLKVKFESLSDAEDAFNINYFDECPVMQEFRSTTTSTPIPRSVEVPHSVESPLLSLQALRNSDNRKLTGSILDVVSSNFFRTNQEAAPAAHGIFVQEMALSRFSFYYVKFLCSIWFPPSPLQCLTSVICKWKEQEHIRYDAVCCHGDMRPEGTPWMPLDRMLFGLIHQNLRFFASENVVNLEAAKD